MSKQKILIVVPSLCIGGQEKIAVETALCLKELYSVKMVTFHSHATEYQKPCEVVCLNESSRPGLIGKIFGQFTRAKKLSAIRKKEAADFVYSFGSTANLTNVLSRGKAKGKTIIAIHGFAGVKKSFVNKYVYSHADKVICIAKAMQSKVLKLYPNLKNTVVLENGYNIAKTSESSKQDACLPKDKFNFICMGRLENVKRYDRVIKAFKAVHELHPNTHLSLVGDGSLKNELVKLSADCALSDNISFLGYQSNPYAFLSKADTFVLCSKSEGFPNALIESLACSLPIVSLDCMSGPREILSEVYDETPVKGAEQRKYGILVEYAADEEQLISLLANGMCDMLENDTLRENYKHLALSRANNFSTQIYFDKLCNILKEA